MKPDRSLLWFGIAGILGLAVDIGVLTASRGALGVYGARVLSFLAAATATWIVNRLVTFSDRNSGLNVWQEYVRYLGLMLGGGIVNFATYSFLAWKFVQTPFWLGIYVCMGSLIGMAVNYLGASRWLYRDRTARD